MIHAFLSPSRPVRLALATLVCATTACAAKIEVSTVFEYGNSDPYDRANLYGFNHAPNVTVAPDGSLIAAAVMADPKLGLITTLGIIAHEVPQEAGDFIVLLNAGYSKARALAYNVLSSCASVAGGVIGYFALGSMTDVLPYVLVLAAASFIYIAVADLIPWMQRRVDTESSMWQIVMVGSCVGTIALTHSFLH